MAIFSSIFGGKTSIGIDIGTTTIKAVELEKSKEAFKLKKYGILETYGHLERLNNAIQTSSLKMLEKETASLLKTLLREAKIKGSVANASLPSFLAFTTLLEMPDMPSADTQKAVGFQAAQHIPIPVSEVVIDWLKVGEREDEQGVKKQQVLLISVPKDYIEKYRNIFKMAGLNLASMEVESLSSARSLVRDNISTLIIDIGDRSSSISIVDKGLLKYVAQTDFAGISLTQALSKGLNVSMRRAEVIKRQKGLLGAGGEQELSTIMSPYLDAIIEEAKRVRSIYESDFGGSIERVRLSGGGANLLGIEKYIFNEIGVETLKGNPFEMVTYSSDVEPAVSEAGPILAVAVGLAMRDLK